MDDPVSLAWIFVLSFIPSSLPLSSFDSLSASSANDSSPAPCTWTLCSFTSLQGWETESRYPGVRHYSLSDFSEWLEMRATMVEQTAEWGHAFPTISYLLPSSATCWRIRVPKSLCFVHLLPSSGPVVAVLGHQGQKGSRLPQTPSRPLWASPRISSLISGSHPLPFHLRQRDK